jgi:hypothetical protein
VVRPSDSWDRLAQRTADRPLVARAMEAQCPVAQSTTAVIATYTTDLPSALQSAPSTAALAEVA